MLIFFRRQCSYWLPTKHSYPRIFLGRCRRLSCQGTEGFLSLICFSLVLGPMGIYAPCFLATAFLAFRCELIPCPASASMPLPLFHFSTLEIGCNPWLGSGCQVDPTNLGLPKAPAGANHLLPASCERCQQRLLRGVRSWEGRDGTYYS